MGVGIGPRVTGVGWSENSRVICKCDLDLFGFESRQRHGRRSGTAAVLALWCRWSELQRKATRATKRGFVSVELAAHVHGLVCIRPRQAWFTALGLHGALTDHPGLLADTNTSVRLHPLDSCSTGQCALHGGLHITHCSQTRSSPITESQAQN